MGTCRKCLAPLPEQTRPGKPREFCTTCRPPRIRPKTKAPVVSLAEHRAPAPARARPTLLAAVIAELEPAGRLEHPDGVAAQMLAEQIDAGNHTAQGAKSLHDALRAARTAALATSEPEADVIDLIFGAEPS
jgi:hypothetical protein